MKISIRCAACGLPFDTDDHSPSIFCSVGCQILRDPIDDSLPLSRENKDNDSNITKRKK